jgi:hypothetical protein
MTFFSISGKGGIGVRHPTMMAALAIAVTHER